MKSRDDQTARLSAVAGARPSRDWPLDPGATDLRPSLRRRRGAAAGHGGDPRRRTGQRRPRCSSSPRGSRGAGLPPLPPFWLLPGANPDGLARRRKNSARDVDLNRNFPARSFATAHAPGYFPGPAPLSEPETRAIAALVAGEPIRGAVAVHAPFGLRQLRRTGRRLGRGGRGRLRLAGARRHRLPYPRLFRVVAGPRLRPAGPDARAPAGPAGPISSPSGGRAGGRPGPLSTPPTPQTPPATAVSRYTA